MAKRSLINIAFEIVILALFIPVMFWISPFTGIAYLITIALAAYSKLLFRRKRIAKLIIVGTILSTIAAFLLFWALDMRSAGNTVATLILIVVAGYIWWRGYKMRKGRR